MSKTQVETTEQIKGILTVANGGTGNPTNPANNVLLGNGTSALQAVAPGSSGNGLISNGSTWVSGALPTQNSFNLDGGAASTTYGSAAQIDCGSSA